MEFRMKPEDLRDLVGTIKEVEKSGLKVNYILIDGLKNEMSMVLKPLTLGKITEDYSAP